MHRAMFKQQITHGIAWMVLIVILQTPVLVERTITRMDAQLTLYNKGLADIV